MENKDAVIHISRSLYDRIERKIAGSKFLNVEEYVCHVLHEVITSQEMNVEALTKEQQARIEARLRSLGYLD